MNIKSKCAIPLALAVSLGMLGARPASAQLPPELEALRRPVPEGDLQKFSSDMTSLVRVLRDRSTNHPDLQSRAAELEQRLANLTPEQLTILANAYDRPAWSRVVEGLRAGMPEAGATPPLAAAGRVSGETVASYPISPSTTTLVTANYGGCTPGTTNGIPNYYYGVGPPIPSDLSVQYGLFAAIQAETAVQVPLNYACDISIVVLGEGTNAEFCIPAGIADEVLTLTQLVFAINQFCDPYVLGAENDAAYSNTIAIFNNLSNTKNDVDTVKSDVISLNSNLTNEGIALSSNILQAQADLDTRVNKVDTDVTTGTSQVDSNIATLQALELRIEIERSLSLGISVGLFETPKSEGGYLEVVGTTVQTVINGLAAAGQNVGNAQQWENYGNAAYAGGYYKAAYHDYLVAYQTAVK